MFEDKERGEMIKQWGIGYDTDYGMNHRRGWSIHEDGACMVSFEKHLIACLIKWLQKRKLYNDESI